MRVWLAGSRSFGTEVYKMLQATPGIEVLAVTAPKDDQLTYTATEHGTLCCREVYPHWVERYAVSLIISAQNYVRIDADSMAAARFGAVGYHPSLLPRHRGRRAVEATIDSGDAIAGGTVYQMDAGWDTGPILLQNFCHVLPGWTASDLWRKELFPMGLRLLGQLIDTTPPWPAQPQDERAVTVC